jgi:hypothetical protein
MAFLACTSIEKEQAILPSDPFLQPIKKLNLFSDSTSFARLPIKSLNLNRAKAFSFSTRDFKHGAFELEGDSALIFVPKETKTWKTDTGFVIVKQSDQTKEGSVIITNNAYKPTIIRPEQPLVWLKGTPLPNMKVELIDPSDSRNISNLIGMEEAGAEIDSVWGFIHDAKISINKKMIIYLAAGGMGNYLNFGTDHIYYRIKRPNGLYFRGLIPVYIGDSTQPMARNDERTFLATGGFMYESDLMANDLGTNPTSPRNPSSLRLEPLAYSERKRVNTQFGILKDSSENGNKAFYYKRTRSGNQADTSFIFLQEGPENRITRSRLIIKP